MTIDVERNVQQFLRGGGKHQGLQPTERYTSFDYCYNYFQAFRERGEVENLAAQDNLQQSCLQVGFYLASWGMLRGSSFLLQRSAKFYEPLIGCIAAADPLVWDIDADAYTEENLERLFRCERQIVAALQDGGKTSATLVTKIMLGVFGNVPAFDTYLIRGLGIRWGRDGRKSLRKVAAFYEQHRDAIDQCEIYTLDFSTGAKTHRRYPKAKIIDMVGFIQGQG